LACSRNLDLTSDQFSQLTMSVQKEKEGGQLNLLGSIYVVSDKVDNGIIAKSKDGNNKLMVIRGNKANLVIVWEPALNTNDWDLFESAAQTIN